MKIMEQEPNEQQLIYLKRKKSLIIIVIGFIIAILVTIGFIYYLIENVYPEEQSQFNNDMSESKSLIDLSERELNQLAPLMKEDLNGTDDSMGSFTNNASVTSCDFWKDKSYGEVSTDFGDGLAGTLSLRGRVIQRVQDASWQEGKQVTVVYLSISDQENSSEQVFYDHYFKMAQGGNAINRIEGEELLIRLGAIENSELITTADISIEIKDRILSLIDKTHTIQLNLTIPIYPGSSVGDNFSFACFISK